MLKKKKHLEDKIRLHEEYTESNTREHKCKTKPNQTTKTK